VIADVKREHFGTGVELFNLIPSSRAIFADNTEIVVCSEATNIAMSGSVIRFFLLACALVGKRVGHPT